MTTMWHVTGTRRAAPIAAEGLRTDADGVDYLYVWLFDDEGVARERAENGVWGGGYGRGDNVVIEVDATGLTIIPDPHPGWGNPAIDDHAFAHAGHIPAERITAIHYPRTEALT